MPCAHLYCDRNGREVFRVTDPEDLLPAPTVGEMIKHHQRRYTIESVLFVESLSPSTLATEYRVRLEPIEEFSQST